VINSHPKLNALRALAIAVIIALSTSTFAPVTVLAQQQQLDSTNYRILDPTVDSGGGAGDSTNYSLLSSMGGAVSDARLESTSYAIGAGFPSGFQANVPLIRCAEGDTDSGTTDCTEQPNAAGSQGECGTPGCYDRGKVEVDHQNNPIDTLYLVSLTNTDTNTEYFLQSDHSVATTYDIADYLTICQLHGVDSRDSACDDAGDGNFDEDLQSNNIVGLAAATTYEVKVRALSGDFTETQYSPTANLTTVVPSLFLDLDIGTTSGVENSAIYTVNIGTVNPGSAFTASDQIWLDLGTNAANGMNTYVRDLHTGLYNGSFTIPSESEDLATDPNANGGFGLKTLTSTQAALGPVLLDSTYNTGGADAVGAVTTSDDLIFYTQESGGNRGPVAEGRTSVAVKTRITGATPSGAYTDTVTFTMVGSF
jgi:hypothetical protein